MWNPEVFDLASRIKEGERIAQDRSLIEKERQAVQSAKDYSYNDCLCSDDDKIIFRIDRTHRDSMTEPKWWFKLGSSIKINYPENNTLSFYSDTGFLFDVWTGMREFSEANLGMYSLELRFNHPHDSTYFPVRFRHGRRKEWKAEVYDLQYYNLAWQHELPDLWDSVPQGLREFIHGELGYTQEKYPNEEPFTFWFKLEHIMPHQIY